MATLISLPDLKWLNFFPRGRLLTAQAGTASYRSAAAAAAAAGRRGEGEDNESNVITSLYNIGRGAAHCPAPAYYDKTYLEQQSTLSTQYLHNIYSATPDQYLLRLCVLPVLVLD